MFSLLYNLLKHIFKNYIINNAPQKILRRIKFNRYKIITNQTPRARRKKYLKAQADI